MQLTNYSMLFLEINEMSVEIIKNYSKYHNISTTIIHGHLVLPIDLFTSRNFLKVWQKF